MGERHARTLHSMGVEVGVVDVDSVRQAALERDVGQSQGPFQAAIVAVPTTQHFELAKQLIERGMHVLVEKPVADDHHKAQVLIDIAAERQVVLHVGHIERFNPAFRRLAAQVQQPIYAEVSRCSVENGRCLDVNVVFDLMIHDIDLLLSVLGLPIRVYATGNGDSARAQILFPDGSEAKLRASRVHDRDVREWHTWDVNGPRLGGSHLHADLYAEKADLADELRAFLNACHNRVLSYDGARNAADALMVAEEISRQVNCIRVAA